MRKGFVKKKGDLFQMKKNLLRVLAVVMAIAVVVVAFAACGDKKEDTSTEPSNEAIATTEATTTDDPSKKEEPSQGDDTTTAPTEPGKEEPGKNPTDKAGMIAAFNGASLKATAFTRTLSSGSLTALGNEIKLVNPDDPELTRRVNSGFNSTNVSESGPLPKLTDAQVASATPTANGFTLTLNNAAGADANGAGGYVTVINQAKAGTLIDQVVDGWKIEGVPLPLKAGMVKIKKLDVTMQNGKYDVTMKDGKVTKIVFTSTEAASVSATAIGFSANGSLTVTLNTTFA